MPFALPALLHFLKRFLIESHQLCLLEFANNAFAAFINITDKIHGVASC
jgi:hypothetical protein